MSKRFIITEDEKTNIKKLYNISEQGIIDVALNAADEYIKQQFSKPGGPTFDNPSTTTPSVKSGTNSSSLSKITAKGNTLLSNPTFKSKLSEISKKIGISEDCIIKVMNHESKLDPSVKNSIGCVGLVQFCPDSKGGSTKTINGKQYDLSQLRNDLGLQMEAIENFWVGGKNQGKIKECGDLQIYNFFPAAAGKSDNYVLQTKGISAEKIANQNPIFNRTLGRDRNTPLTVGDIKQYQQKTGIA
jgi:hypothetical protein